METQKQTAIGRKARNLIAGLGLVGLLGGCETVPNDGSSTYHYSQADEWGALSALNALGASNPENPARNFNAYMSSYAANEAGRQERIGHARALQESVSTIAGAIENRNAQQNYQQQIQRATGEIHKVWLEHNVYESNQKGMRVHTSFDVNNHKDRPLIISAYFYDANGRRLEDSDGKYNSTGGQVSVGSNIVYPNYNRSTWNDFSIFMPYDQLEVRTPGRNNLNVKVDAWDMSTRTPSKITETGFTRFWVD